MNRPSWLRYLNPLHFEPKYMRWSIWSNVAMAILFLSVAIVLQYVLKPTSLSIVVRSFAFEAHMKETVGSDKLFPIMVKQEQNIRDYFSEMAEASSIFALASIMFSLALAHNAFYFYKARQLIPPDAVCPLENKKAD